MAFAYGDSYLKLPPISKEGAVELDGENSKRGSGIVRDKHGLVRLPPIVRLDSLRSTSSASRLRNETQTATPADSESELSTLIAPSKLSHKMESLRRGSSSKFKKYSAKREDETKLMKDPAVKETNEDQARFFDGEEASHGKQKNRFRFGSNTQDKSTRDADLMPLFKESVLRRRDSSTFQSLGKLARSHRLAKSSPELSNRKINLRRRPESTLSSLTEGHRSTSRSRLSQPRLSVHDIDGSTLSHLQNTSKIEEKQKEHEKQIQRSNHRWVNDGPHQPQSTPSSPVCSESVNKEIKQKGRKSLNDITDAIQLTDRKRPSLIPKKQNLIQESEVLKIEGKSCVHNERERPRDHVPGRDGHVDTLHPPKQDEKRHSLYDLQQILTLLQEENLKRQTSSTASTLGNARTTSNASDKASNASVYDLREFLMLAAAEASNASAGQTAKMKTNSSQHLLLPGQERENARNERKGSVYDLMEFLSLGSVAETESSSASENSSRATSPRIVLNPESSCLKDALSVTTHTEEERRSSTYDLMEFLSLSRSGGSSRSDSGQSTPALRGHDSSAVENDESPLGRQKKENRSLSVYDLAEFLSMTSAVPPLVRVTPASDEEQAKASANHAQSSGTMNKDLNMPRQSVYDLREILNIMQQEHERKRESTYNLQEILSKMQREADEKTHLTSANQDTRSSPSPPMTASSGYSSASDYATSASARHLEANTSNRQMSVYDLKEFLSLHAIQQSQPNQQQLSSAMLRRKFSGVSQSGVSIHVTDESNRSIDSEVFEDVFLPVPGTGTDPSGPSNSHKRSSVYDLREFLNILNADESPLRRRLSSVSSASSKTSESEPESNSRKSDLAGANENITAGGTRPQLSPRQDSGGSMSLYDLGEFLSLLNTDESPLRRRLSSATDIMAGEGEIRVRTPVLSRSDSEKGLYSLEEILTLMNDLEQKRISENTSGELEVGSGEEISIQVPTLPPKTDKINTQPLSSKKRLQSQRSLKSVPETSEVKSNISNSS